MQNKKCAGSAKNTDVEIWRKIPDDYYSPSIHVTEQGGIGIKVGGYVLVAPVERWFAAGEAANRKGLLSLVPDDYVAAGFLEFEGLVDDSAPQEVVWCRQRHWTVNDWTDWLMGDEGCKRE